MRAMLWFVALAACYHPSPPSGAPCASNGACPDGLVCDVSRTPPVCVDRIAADAGADPDAAPDAPPPDAMLPPPAFVVSAHARAGAVATLSYPLTIPPGDGRFLIVTVQLGSNCTGAVPNVLGVTYGGIELTGIMNIVGTPCGMTTTRADQWRLIAPPVGTHDVVVTLSGPGFTIHSGALAFTGVNQLSPVRAVATARGASTQSTVTVASQPGDLVVNTVGHGGGIGAPGAGQIERFKRNQSTTTTLDNSAASTAIAIASTTAMTWTFIADDEWQTISSALRP